MKEEYIKAKNRRNFEIVIAMLCQPFIIGLSLYFLELLIITPILINTFIMQKEKKKNLENNTIPCSEKHNLSTNFNSHVSLKTHNNINTYNTKEELNNKREKEKWKEGLNGK